MIVEAAMRLYQMGWCVLPMMRGTKRPALKNWKRYQKSRPAESTVRNWFPESTDKNLAVVLGPVSGGLVCRDFDRMDAYHTWAAEYPEWASRLPQSETSRGRHVFCITESEAVERISPTGSTIIDFTDGELRGGGLVVLPPSVHESGHIYRWIIPPNDIPFVDLTATGLGQCWSEQASDASPCIVGSRSDFTEEDRENRGGLKTTDVTEDNRCRGSRGTLAADFEFSSIRNEIEQAIVATLPTETGQRNKAVFEFCRHLKAIPALSKAKLPDLRDIALEWHARALPFIETKSPEETLMNFYRGWPQVNFPAGAEPLKQLFREALVEPLPHCCERYPTYEFKVLIALCRKLHHHWQPNPFMLSCRKAGELLDVSHTTANSWLSLLTFDGVLICRELGTAKTQRASRYFYRGD